MDINEMSEDLAAVMARQLRLRGGSLAEVAVRAGRKLPKHLHAEARVITEALTLADHPKLAHRVDEKRLRKAERKLRYFLGKQDPKAERRAEILDRLAFFVFILFVTVVGAFFVALSQGYFDHSP